MHHQTRSLFALSVFALGLSASAQIAGNLLYDANTRVFFQQAEQPVKATIQGNMLVLEVNAMMNARADSYLAIFHVSQVGQTAEEADSLINERIDGMQARLKRDKLKVDDVFIDMLSFVPVFEYETLRKGWEEVLPGDPSRLRILQKNIHVRFSDAKVLDRIVTAAAKEE